MNIHEIVERMNVIGQADASMRAEWAAQCVLLGHKATGEQLLTSPPTEICWYCGEKFRHARGWKA